MNDALLGGLIGAGGALVGVLVSQLLEIVRQNRAFATRQKEKIIDRRIDAHESVIDLAETMIAVVMPDIEINDLPNDTEKPIRAVGILYEKSLFEDWWGDIFYKCYKKHMWLSPKVLKELNLVQDYIINTSRIVNQLDDNEIKRLSVVVRPDFIDMAGNLRRESINYLSKDAINLNLKDLNSHHKYKRPVAERRLNNTLLVKEFSNYLN